MNLCKFLYLLIILTVFQGCFSGTGKYQIPIKNVVDTPKFYKEEYLLWGGVVVGRTVLKSKRILIEVYKKPLNSDGRPIEHAKSDQKFLISCSRDLQFAGNRAGQIITVFGRFENLFNPGFEDKEERLPVIDCIEVYLWEEGSVKKWPSSTPGNSSPFLDNPNFLFNGLIGR